MAAVTPRAAAWLSGCVAAAPGLDCMPTRCGASSGRRHVHDLALLCGGVAASGLRTKHFCPSPNQSRAKQSCVTNM